MVKLMGGCELRRIKRARLRKARSDVRQAIDDFVRRRGAKVTFYAMILDWFGWRELKKYVLVDYGPYIEYLICIDEGGRLHKNYYWTPLTHFPADDLEFFLSSIKSL